MVPHIWSGAAHLDSPSTPISPEIDTFRYWVLGSPARAPRQLFAIGLTYRAHELESGFAIPEDPPVFTKFVSSITGPITEVALPHCGHTDWEVELVVTVGAEA